MSDQRPSTPFTRGYIRGLERACADTRRFIKLAEEGRGQPDWLPGLRIVGDWLQMVIDQRAVNAADLVDEPTECMLTNCPRDGDCPTHGRNRPGQTITEPDG